MWAEMSASAEEIFNSLPKQNVDPSWAHVEGFARCATAWVAFVVAKCELERTTKENLRRLRRRQLRALERELSARAKLMGSAIAARARLKSPDATPAQIFLLLGERFRVLGQRFFSLELPEKDSGQAAKDGSRER
jgi:hypothetical protein